MLSRAGRMSKSTQPFWLNPRIRMPRCRKDSRSVITCDGIRQHVGLLTRSLCVQTSYRATRSAFGSDAEFRESLHWPRQYSFVAPRYDGPLDQFRMVGHDPHKLIITQVSSNHVLSVGFLVRSQGVLWFQPSTPKQLLKRVEGERLRQIVDGLVIHTFRSQDPLDLAALASSRLLVNRDFGGRHFTASLSCSIRRRHLSPERILP